MSFLCLGINHRTAHVDLRERLAFAEKDVELALQQFRDVDSVNEVVLVSTCNRVELYVGLENPNEGVEKALLDRMSIMRDVDCHHGGHFYSMRNADAAKHLFEVVAGLDSMVLGETEIFGQVKESYRRALEGGSTGRQLNKIFQASFSVGKRLRSRTGIQRGATSIGSVAVELAERIFGDLKKSGVMILGAGEMSRVTAKSLVSRGAKSVVVSNRSYDRAVELAEEMHGEAIRFDDWQKRAVDMDVIVSSTSAPHHVVTKADMIEIRKKRHGRPLFLIDIAVPRDIDPDVNDLDEIYLYDIDALESLAAEARFAREAQIAECRVLIEKELRQRLNGVIDVGNDE